MGLYTLIGAFMLALESVASGIFACSYTWFDFAYCRITLAGNSFISGIIVAQKKFYVVWQGRETGIFTDWPSCQKQVQKFAGARFKSFPTRTEAEAAFSSSGAPAAGKPGSTRTPGNKPSKSASSRKTVKTYGVAEIAKLDFDTHIYTDGGCEPNPGEAGSGMAIYRKGKISELWYGLYNPEGTNNTAELSALYQAMLVAKDELAEKRSVVIFSDSKYSIQCVTQWAVNWQKRGWTKPSGEIKNLELIKTMFALYESLKDQLQILHVNGHVGVEGNELADRMSIKAISENVVDFELYQEKIDIDEILALRAG